jgi:hypothetical protein
LKSAVVTPCLEQQVGDEHLDLVAGGAGRHLHVHLVDDRLPARPPLDGEALGRGGQGNEDVAILRAAGRAAARGEDADDAEGEIDAVPARGDAEALPHRRRGPAREERLRDIGAEHGAQRGAVFVSLREERARGERRPAHRLVGRRGADDRHLLVRRPGDRLGRDVELGRDALHLRESGAADGGRVLEREGHAAAGRSARAAACVRRGRLDEEEV